MKVITIRQPWATLIAIGEKEFETRSWQTKYRGTIAIHAGKQIDKAALDYVTIMTALLRHGIKSHKELPTGAIIATADLIECHKIKADYFPVYDEEKAVTENGLLIDGDEYWCGDYTEGRFAWQLASVKQIEPIPAKGQLSLWEYPDL